MHKQIAPLDYLQSNIRKKKDKECIINHKKINSITCNIDDIKIHQIAYFLSNILPNCNSFNIKLGNVRNGTIIGKGEFGYSFKINTNDKSYIIKIIICSPNSEEILQKEIDINKKITLSQNNNFINMLAFYEFNEKKNIYTYSNYNKDKDKYIIETCKAKTMIHKSNMCEKYILLEAGEMDMMDYLFNKKININSLIDLFYDLIKNFYKITDFFLRTNEIFTHNDIKLENIIIVNNKLKLIDFGQSILIKKFHFRGTLQPIIETTLFNNDIRYKRISILTDIFSACFTTIYSVYIITNKKTKENIKTEDITYNKLKSEISNKKYKEIVLLSDLIIFFYHVIIHFTKIIQVNFHDDSNTQIYEKILDINNLNIIINQKKIIYKEKEFKLEDKKLLEQSNIFNSIKFPEYVHNTNKLNGDYNYIDNIVKHILS